MFESIENIKLININEGKTRAKGEGFYLKERKSHIFVFRTAGSGTHRSNDKDLNSVQGEMVYIPKGVAHDFVVTSDEPCSSIYIAFLADIKNPSPTLYSLNNLPEKDTFPQTILRLWRTGLPMEKHLCMSMFHYLIAHLLKIEKAEYADKSKLHIIEPAIEYINEHIFDSSLKIDILPTLCGISPAYFRKIFLSNFGVTPQKYMEDKRLTHAMKILASKVGMTITDTAHAVGYDDPLYFSKVFKRKYGVPPSSI